VLEHGTVLHRSDLTGTLESQDEAVGDVVRHPVTSGLALRNGSGADWFLVRHDSRPPVPPGAAVLLRDGQTVGFGRTIGRVSIPR
jgi:hypothetical protein